MFKEVLLLLLVVVASSWTFTEEQNRDALLEFESHKALMRQMAAITRQILAHIPTQQDTLNMLEEFRTCFKEAMLEDRISCASAHDARHLQQLVATDGYEWLDCFLDTGTCTPGSVAYSAYTIWRTLNHHPNLLESWTCQKLHERVVQMVAITQMRVWVRDDQIEQLNRIEDVVLSCAVL